MTKLTENERKALNNACARLRETNLGTKIGNIEDFLDIDILKTDANTVSKAIDELFDKWANPLLNITVPPPGFFTLAGDAEGNLWCYCNDETNPPVFEHDETTGDLYLNIASEDGANSYQVHVGNYIAVKHLNDYYKKTEIDSKLGGKSNVGHNHDERYYTETEIDAKVNNINSQINSLIGFTATIVNSLPSTGEVGVMYLKLNTSASVEGNIYDEYIWVNNKFEKIGSTETTVDLSGYVTQTEMNTQLANKAKINHGHLSHDIEINPDEDDGMWMVEYGLNRQTDVNCYVYDHEKKLENIDDGANKTVVDSSLSSSSKNPVQNKVVNSALNGKSNTGHEHTSDEIHYAYDQNVSVTTILENKAAKNHTHDDRYYTEAEIDEKLNGKADSNHMHNDVSILKQVDNDWVGLPVWYMVKNGWCILQWENPIIYLGQNNISIPTNSWFKLGNVPVPQTGRPVYQQLTTSSAHIRIQITGGGVLQSYMTGNNIWSYGTLVYPTKDTS
ncbi:hypothetical protein [Methanobrevibacter smithii]|uniref:hypothetical protein n=1 Tax=Methanobrevibacter smithii TaxID=2173 RepID=UPI0037DC01B8